MLIQSRKNTMEEKKKYEMEGGGPCLFVERVHPSATDNKCTA